jgi:hypothetical protein
MIAVLNHNANLPVEIDQEAGALLQQLYAVGWKVSVSHYDANSFGNWYVDLRFSNLMIRLFKDRSQYMIDGPPKKELEAAGLRKAFEDMEEFQHAVIKWANSPK